MSVQDLKRLDTRVIPSDNNNEIRVFCTVRNEMLRLPYFLDYYREKGVERFIFIDNASDDGTAAYLLKQPDCHLFSTDKSFREARAGIDWKNALLDEYGTGHWCLSLDADEILVWPHAEYSTLHDLCDWLDQKKSEGIYTFLLDMYADKRIADAHYEPGTPFIQSAPMFDQDYTFHKRVRLAFWKGSAFPKYSAHGGPRLRTFYPEQIEVKSYALRYIRRCGWELCRLMAYFKIFDMDKMPHPAPMLFKVPLVKWRKGCAYKSATHLMESPIKLSKVTGILLHFKFFSDFHDKVESECVREEYFGKSVEYKKYRQHLREEGHKVLFQYEDSAYFKDTQDLVTRKLMNSNTLFDAFISNRTSRKAKKKKSAFS